MATVRKIQLRAQPTFSGPFEVNEFNQQSRERLERLLIRNHEKYHLTYHLLGAHNHIFHHLMCIYALGATPQQLDQAYDLNAAYQLPAFAPNESHIVALTDPTEFKKCLGYNQFFNNYFAFFQKEIETAGIERTLNKYLFEDSDLAKNMFERLFGGYLHCLIHLGYGLEFGQPYIIAEALASVAVHLPELQPFHSGIYHAAQSNFATKSLLEILDELRQDKKVQNAMHYDYIDKINDGLIAEAGDQLFRIIAQWRVSPEEVEFKAAELINASVYLTCLAQRPEKQIRFDFFLLHSITTANFLPAFLNASYIKPATLAKIIERMGSAILLFYAEAGTPELRPQELDAYKPQHPSGFTNVFSRACDYRDDGHLAKLIRGVATAAKMTKPYTHRMEFGIKREKEFLTIAHMIMDSAENFNNTTATYEVHEVRKTTLYSRLSEPEVQLVIARWPRYVGFKEAWDRVADRRIVPAGRL